MKVVNLNVVMLVVKLKGVLRSENGFNLLNSVSQVRLRLLWVLAMKGWSHATYHRLVLSPRVRSETTALQCSPNARRNTDDNLEEEE